MDDTIDALRWDNETDRDGASFLSEGGARQRDKDILFTTGEAEQTDITGLLALIDWALPGVSSSRSKAWGNSKFSSKTNSKNLNKTEKDIALAGNVTKATLDIGNHMANLVDAGLKLREKKTAISVARIYSDSVDYVDYDKNHMGIWRISRRDDGALPDTTKMRKVE